MQTERTRLDFLLGVRTLETREIKLRQTSNILITYLKPRVLTCTGFYLYEIKKVSKMI